MGKKPSPWQKLVRGTIREIINDLNDNNFSKNQPQKSKIKAKSRKRKKRNIPTTTRVDVLKRDNYRCVFCGATAKEARLQIDHIIPISKGGNNELNNLQTLCWECNRGKSDRLL